MKLVPLRRTISAAFFLAVAACSRGGDSGVALPEVPTFDGVIDLEIGEMAGDDPYLFSYIVAVAADEQGRVIVADRDAVEIRVFGPEGDFAFHFGGRGEGPGEFGDICCMEFGPDGELWVRESARYSTFVLDSASAEHRRVLRTPYADPVGLREPFIFDMAGDLVFVGLVRGDDDVSGGYARLRVLPDGGVDTVVIANAEDLLVGSKTVPFERGPYRGVDVLRQPFGPQWVHAHANGGAWAEAVTSDYSINYHHPDGTASVIEGPALQGPPLSKDDRDRAQSWIDRERERVGIDDYPFEIPDRKPPLADMFFDRAGRLWIVKTVGGRSGGARSGHMGRNDARGALSVAEPDLAVSDALGYGVRAVRSYRRLARCPARGAGAVRAPIAGCRHAAGRSSEDDRDSRPVVAASFQKWYHRS